MPVWLCCGCRGTHGHREQFVPIGLFVRWHSHELPCVQPRRVVYHVRPGEHDIQRRHWFIRIRTGVCHGIDHPVAQSAPPLRRGELCPATGRSQFPSVGGVARSARVVREFKNAHLLPIVTASNKKVLRAKCPQTYAMTHKNADRPPR